MKKVRLGLVGLGRGFMLTLPALRADPRAELVAAFDLRPEARDRFAEEFGAKSHASLSSLLADPDVDAVYIATPHELHAKQSIEALEAGKHVLVEKPMATSLEDCAAMAEAARVTGLNLVVGPSHGFDAPVKLAADIVASGEFGRTRLITALNYTDFVYRPRRPEELDTARGGGVVFSQAAHQIDIVRRIAGEEVSSVRAHAGNWDPARGGEGAYVAFMSFESGLTATLTYSGYAHFDSDELMGWISELGRRKDPASYGEARKMLAAIDPEDEAAVKEQRAYGRGRTAESLPAELLHEHFGFVLISCEHADLRLRPDGVMIYSDASRELRALPAPQFPRKGVLDEFVAAILENRKPLHDAVWGLETMSCCDALLESSRARREIAVSRPASRQLGVPL